jgi:hypothetical protein
MVLSRTSTEINIKTKEMIDDTVQFANIIGEIWHPKGSVHRTEAHL